MRRSLLGVLILVVLGQSPVLAQDRSRPASAPDFIGIFQLLDFPNQPPHLKENPWPAPCQFFGHYPDGYWLHQQTQGRSCANAIPQAKPTLPQTVRWQMLQEGFVLVDRQDVKVREVWKVDRVNKPTHLDRTNLNEGDLIMQLVDPGTKRVVWIRLLRRVGSPRRT
jgi:hypothetical protein